MYFVGGTVSNELIQHLKLSGTLFKHRELAHPFTLTGTDLEEVTEKTYRGKYLVMNIFPSVETDTCAKSVRVFNESATQVSVTHSSDENK